MSNTITYALEADMQNLLERQIEPNRKYGEGNTAEKNCIATPELQQGFRLCLEAGWNGTKS